MEVGQQGYLAYLNAYVLRVEFLGYDAYEPDYPGERTRYYRALEPCKCSHEVIEVGSIIDEHGAEDEELFENRADAEAVVKKDAAYWMKRKEQELEELRKRAGQ